MPPGFSGSSRRRDDPVFRRRSDGAFLCAGRSWTMVPRWPSFQMPRRPTGFPAVGGLATGERAMEIWIIFGEKTPPKLWGMTRAEALGYCRIYLREKYWRGWK